MPRYRGPETHTVRERWISQGKGSGFGGNYQPWIKVGDFPNRTNSYRIKSLITGRTHHYFSALEYRHHLLAEYLGFVKDIREQYPLHPISETLALAYEMGIAHPSFAGHASSITTDSLLTIDDGQKRYLLPRSLKYSHELHDYRVMEKLELERSTWLERGEMWELLTEKELTETMEKNLRWMRGWQTAQRPPPDEALIEQFVRVLAAQNFHYPLGVILERVSKTLCIGRMLAVYLFRFAAWNRYFDVDLYTPLQLTKPHLALRSSLACEDSDQ